MASNAKHLGDISKLYKPESYYLAKYMNYMFNLTDNNEINDLVTQAFMGKRIYSY